MESVVKCKNPKCGTPLPVSKLIMGYCPMCWKWMQERQRQR